MADTVAAPIEQQVNGVEDMLYMSSQCSNDGTYQLTVTFKVGTDLNMAQVLVQNRVNLAMPTLPDLVKQIGVTTMKRSPDLMLIVNLISPDGRGDQLYLSNYALIQVRDEWRGWKGWAKRLFSANAIIVRVWLSPDRLASRNMTAGDAVEALREQNVQVAAGQIGQQPATTASISNIRSPPSAGDRSRAIRRDRRQDRGGRPNHPAPRRGADQLGARNEDINSYLDGKPAAGIGVFQLPGSNALETAERVKAKMRELKKRFPFGVDYRICYDTTPYISESIHEVFNTLGAAVLLVAWWSWCSCKTGVLR